MEYRILFNPLFRIAWVEANDLSEGDVRRITQAGQICFGVEASLWTVSTVEDLEEIIEEE